jgi:signal transduction histidine kinase
MSAGKQRSAMTAAVMLLVFVVGLFAFALARSHVQDRRDAETRFVERARISAALTESLFSSTAAQAAEQNSRRLGGKTIDQARLERQRSDSRLKYAVVLDEQGRIIAATRKLPAEVRARLTAQPGATREALGGRGYNLSDFIAVRGTKGFFEYTGRFKTKFGDRVLVSGFPASAISGFLAAYLGRLPDARQSTAYVLDARDRIVGSPSARQPSGSVVREPGLIAALGSAKGRGEFDSSGTKRSFASAPVKGSTWKVVLSERSSTLYSGTGLAVQWLVLLALTAAGAVAVFLLRRGLRSAAAIEQANTQLEVANAELAHTNLELTRSNGELEQFASVASHDLQEPLRKVQSFGDQLERRFAADLPPEARDYLRRMRGSANRMSTLIDDLLRFSRVTTKPPALQTVDLAETAREVLAADLDGLVRETHGSVHIGALGTIEADGTQMRQLLQNLIANALKFHRPDEAPEVRVEPVPCDKPDCIAFVVSDNGIGFDARYAERIFRVFERLHPRDVFTGTGIGLALCRRIVERHGGEIVAESRDGEGARFTVTLPRTATRMRQFAPEHPEPEQTEREESDDRVPAHV